MAKLTLQQQATLPLPLPATTNTRIFTSPNNQYMAVLYPNVTHILNISSSQI